MRVRRLGNLGQHLWGEAAQQYAGALASGGGNAARHPSRNGRTDILWPVKPMPTEPICQLFLILEHWPIIVIRLIIGAIWLVTKMIGKNSMGG